MSQQEEQYAQLNSNEVRYGKATLVEVANEAKESSGRVQSTLLKGDTDKRKPTAHKYCCKLLWE